MLVEAMRCGVYIVNAVQSKEPFREHKERPTIFLVGDDLGWAVGPDGFHMPSVRRAIRSSVAFSVISCAPLAEAYAMPAAKVVARGDNVMIVETSVDRALHRPRHTCRLIVALFLRQRLAATIARYNSAKLSLSGPDDSETTEICR